MLSNEHWSPNSLLIFIFIAKKAAVFCLILWILHWFLLIDSPWFVVVFLELAVNPECFPFRGCLAVFQYMIPTSARDVSLSILLAFISADFFSWHVLLFLKKKPPLGTVHLFVTALTNYMREQIFLFSMVDPSWYQSVPWSGTGAPGLLASCRIPGSVSSWQLWRNLIRCFLFFQSLSFPPHPAFFQFLCM